jgi:hypothetical protein
MPNVPYPYEVNGKLVTGNGSLIQPRIQPPTSWPRGLDRNELRKLYRQGYWLAIEDYPKLVSQENLLVPSAYDSEDEDEDASPRASTYPIGFKWYHDPNGNWGLTSVSTAKTRNDKRNVGEAAACTLTRHPQRSGCPFYHC